MLKRPTFWDSYESAVHYNRDLYDKVESHIRGLKALGVEPDSYGTMLAHVLLNKLPPDVRLIISRKTGRPEPKIDQLLKYVEEELTARERTAHNATPPSTRQPDKVKPTATVLFVQLCHCVANASRTAHQGIAPWLLVLLLGSRFSGPVVDVSTALPGDILAETLVLQADTKV